MSSKCYDICHLVDAANNDIAKILKLAASRNICRREKQGIDIKYFTPKSFSSEYIRVKGKCTTCDCNYYVYDGLMCPCCGLMLRTSKKKNVKIFTEPEALITPIIRSHTDYTIVKRNN